MKGDRVEIVVDAGTEPRTYEVSATRAGRRVDHQREVPRQVRVGGLHQQVSVLFGRGHGEKPDPGAGGEIDPVGLQRETRAGWRRVPQAQQRGEHGPGSEERDHPTRPETQRTGRELAQRRAAGGAINGNIGRLHVHVVGAGQDRRECGDVGRQIVTRHRGSLPGVPYGTVRLLTIR